MRYIRKHPQGPSCLRAYPRGSDWSAVDSECVATVRSALSEDQCGICCYCMCRLREHTKVEHFRPQAAHKDQRTEWRNLLLACPGGEGKGPGAQTCDTHKGQQPLTLDPTDPRIATLISFNSAGEVTAILDGHRAELVEVLNLNATHLVEDRKSALEGLRKRLIAKYGSKGKWAPGVLQRELDELQARRPLLAYSAFLEWWLKSQIQHHS